MKKLVFLLFVVSLLIISGSVLYASTYYDDLENASWAESYINDFTQKGIISGYGNRQFMPSKPVTREEFSKVVVLTFDYKIEGDANFSDVKKDDWFYPYVATLTYKGIIKGVGEGKFGTGHTITRQDICTIVYRVLKDLGYSFEVNNNKVMAFKDSGDIADYAREAVETLFKMGVINGVSEDEFAPKSDTTRAQMVKILWTSDNSSSSKSSSSSSGSETSTSGEVKPTEEKTSGEQKAAEEKSSGEQQKEEKKTSSGGGSSSSSVAQYTIKFVNEDGTVLQQGKVNKGATPTYKGETPEKAETEDVAYEFDKWTPEIAKVIKDATYTATYKEVNKYTIKFVDEDETVLQESKFKEGSTPTFSGDEPTKEETVFYSYEFSGWTPEIAEVSGEATYTATYTETVKELDYIPIFEVSELQQVATSNEVNIQGFDFTMTPTAKYKLMNDLDLTGVDFSPIVGFQGEFDGNDYTISNLTIDNRDGEKTYQNLDSGYDAYHPAGLFENIIDGTIMNLNVVSAHISADESAAVIAGQGNNFTIDNCSIQDVVLDGVNACGGIVGYVGSQGGTITNCKVTNIDGVGSNGTAGICGTSKGDITICSGDVIDDREEPGTYYSGIIACAFGNVEINNCSVQGLMIKASGMISESLGQEITVTGCTANDITLLSANPIAIMVKVASGKLTITDCDVDTVQTQEGCSNQFGAMVGVASCGSNEILIDNCTAKNLNILGYGAGIAYLCGSNQAVTITNCEVSDATFDGASSGYNFGGILCISQSSGLCTIKNCDVKNYTALTSSYGSFGGLVAVPGASSYDVDKCNVEGVNATNCSMFGGILGMYGSISGAVKNSNVKNVTLNNTTKAHNDIGGIVSANASTVEITKCNVSKFNVKSNATYMNFGGITAVLISDNADINDCHVEELDLQRTAEASTSSSEPYSFIGGIVGISNSTSSISKCSVKSSKIVANLSTTGSYSVNERTGGIIGQSRSSITSCDVDKFICTVSDTKDSINVHLGGISGINLTGTISKCNVSSSDITLNGHSDGNILMGGVVGITNNGISECTVKETDVIFNNSGYVDGTTYGANHMGGIAGIGSSQISDCSVEKCTITSYGMAGGIGGISFYIKDSDVTDSTIQTLANTTGPAYAGGFSGCGGYEIKNCNSKNNTIKGCRMAGGITSNSSGLISSCSVVNCEVIASASTSETFAGGIAGCSYGNLENNIVTGTTVEGNSFVGGLAGNSLGVKDCSASSGDVINKGEYDGSNFTGGLVGCVTNSSLVTGSSAEHLNVTGVGFVGGIAGNNSGTIEDCEVNSLVIQNSGSTETSYTGGIVGATATVDGCDVKSTTISGGAQVGGIKGEGNASGAITNCTVEDCEIEGSGIAGRGNRIITGCEVIDSTLTGYGIENEAGSVDTSEEYTKLQITGCSVTGSSVAGGRALGLPTYDLETEAFIEEDDTVECTWENNT